MSKLSTLNYLINTNFAGNKKIESLQLNYKNSIGFEFNDDFGFEPSQKSIEAILNFSLQFDVLKSKNSGEIELNLN